MLRTARSALFAMASVLSLDVALAADEFFEVRVIDSETRRGIPMVELTTVDDVTYIADSAGRIAIDESTLEASTVFFKVHSPGYETAKDGFGFAGARVVIAPGKSKIIELTRISIAERMYRVTGRDIYRDTVRLGHSSPLKNPLNSGLVVGQDSVQPVIYRGQLYWFWGDTNRLSYPLGLYRTAGAVSQLPSMGGLAPADGINFQYFADDTGFARAMTDVANKEGVVWIHGVCTVVDADGKDRMVAQYSRRRGLSEPLEQGLLLWHDDRQIFEVLDVIDLHESWRIVSDHPTRHSEDGREYLCFGNPFPVTRVPAILTALRDRAAYESWTCREELAGDNPTPEQLAASLPVRDSAGKLVWNWRKAPPVTQHDERRWVKQSLMAIDEAKYLPLDMSQDQNGKLGSDAHRRRSVEMHSGTVFFNSHRNRWVMIAIEQAWDKDSPSFLGEVFYSEADSPQGPYQKAMKIATHPKQSFYNPCHHPFFDQNNGRTIYFEGTYCNTFTNSPATPRYNYNQLMYRLDLGDARIVEVFGGDAGKQSLK